MLCVQSWVAKIYFNVVVQCVPLRLNWHFLFQSNSHKLKSFFGGTRTENFYSWPRAWLQRFTVVIKYWKKMQTHILRDNFMKKKQKMPKIKARVIWREQTSFDVRWYQMTRHMTSDDVRWRQLTSWGQSDWFRSNKLHFICTHFINKIRV